MKKTAFALLVCLLPFAFSLHAEDKMETKTKNVKILYTNWRGEKAWRTILPENIYFGSTEYHPEEQWLLKAFDVEKNAYRDFAVKDIASWIPES